MLMGLRLLNAQPIPIQSRAKLVNVFNPAKVVVINSVQNAQMASGKNRITIPVTLPPSTLHWYYRITINPIDHKIAEAASTLLQDIMALTATAIASGGTALAIASIGAGITKLLAKPPPQQHADFFVLDDANALSFKAGKSFYFQDALHNTVSTNAESYFVPKNHKVYIGLRNNNYLYGTKASIEIVAHVGWLLAQKQDLKSKCDSKYRGKLYNGSKIQLNEEATGAWCDCYTTKLISAYTPDDLENLSETELIPFKDACMAAFDQDIDDTDTTN